MDKNKIIEGAAKLVAKGAYDKAIKEYQKVLEADPKEVRILQKMGELFQKKNDNAQAAHYFTKVAESYSSDGFFLKAVALYKQVLKLNPNLVDINLKLAELHQQLQLMSEAMAYYQLVANHYDKAGNIKSSLDTLKKMVDLEPDNVASRIKLAELYAREEMSAQALPEFQRAADYLKRNNRTDDYLRVAERISALEPNNVALARELSSSYLQKGDQKRALAKLQVCFKADPRDVETLNLLAQAFEGLGQTSKTISVYKELAKIQEEKGRRADVNEIWARIEKLDPGDPDLAARRAPIASAPVRPTIPDRPAPSQTVRAQPAPARPAPSSPAAASPSGGFPRDQLSKLLTETDVYVKYGLHDKALEHLRKIFTADPENLDAHEKAYNIYVASNNSAQAGDQLLNVLRLCTRRGDVTRGQSYLNTILQQNPNHPEVPAFLAVLRPGDDPEATGEHEAPEDAILVDSNDEEIIVADAPEDALAGAAEDLALAAAAPEPDSEEEVVAEDYGADSEGDQGHDEVIEDEPLHDEVIEEDEETVNEQTASRDEVIEDEVVEDEAFEATAADEVIEDEVIEDEVIEDEVVEEEVLDEEIVQDGLDVTAGDHSAPAYELDEEPRTQAGFDAVQSPLPRPAEREPMRGSSSMAEAVEDEVAAAAGDEEDPAGAECDEAAFILDQGLIEEAREILDTLDIAFPGHSRAAELRTRLDEMEQAGATEPEPAEDEAASPPSVSPVDAGADEGHDAFDLAAELAGELGEAAEEAAPLSAAGDDFQYSVEEVFSEFKKGLEKVVKPEDVETHYDLGIAYKEMGLLDDAIGEFNVARQGCLKKKKEIDCLTMIAMLQSMKGAHTEAIDTLKQAVGSELATGDTAKALEFELGAAWEANGNPAKALFHYQKVAKLDPKFRDVAGMVSRLAATTKPEDDPMPRAGKGKGDVGEKTRKVGYL